MACILPLRAVSQCEAPLKWFLLVTALAASLAIGALALISVTAVRTFVVRGYDGRIAFQLARSAGLVVALYLAPMALWCGTSGRARAGAA